MSAENVDKKRLSAEEIKLIADSITRYIKDHIVKYQIEYDVNHKGPRFPYYRDMTQAIRDSDKGLNE